MTGSFAKLLTVPRNRDTIGHRRSEVPSGRRHTPASARSLPTLLLAVSCGAGPAVPARQAATEAVSSSALPTPQATERVELGSVTATIATSRTASLFHAIDQMSLWSPFSHPQYKEWRPTGAEADALLARHTRLRGRRGWGQGLESACYVADPDPAHALDVAVSRGLLSRQDAEEEKAILAGLAPQLEAKLALQEARQRELIESLQRESPRFARLFARWASLLDQREPQLVAVVLVPSPGRGQGGGGANGEALVVELPENGSVLPTLTTIAHEMVHLLLRPKASALTEAAERCGDRLDAMTLNEGLAYATAPGLFAWGASKTALEDAAASAAPRSSYRGFYEVAIGIRPALQERAWNRAATPADFAALLDAGCAAWKGRGQPPG